MRKIMTKEITKTNVRVGKIKVVDGQPQLETMPDEILLGNVSMEKAQKEVRKKHGENATVFGVEADTNVYELEVEEFIKHARIKEDQEETEEI